MKWVGLQNYRTLITQPGLPQTDFGSAIRNNFYFVIFTVPLQTIFALWLAVLVNNRFLRGRSFFRTAFYFPSITSSIAITTIFIFLFQGTGVVNTILGWVGIKGPNWLYDEQGIFWSFLSIFGVNSPPGWAQHMVLGISVWDWLSARRSGCASSLSWPCSQPRARSCFSSWLLWRTLARSSTRPARSTEPPVGRGSDK